MQAPCWLEQTADLPPGKILSCANGLLNLPEEVLLPHTPLFYCRHSLDYAYDPKAPKPEQWLGFLPQLWPGDPEAIRTLQEIFGYCLLSNTEQQKLFLIVGPKRSGKGTLARVLTKVLGRENVCNPTLASLGTNFGLSALIGKNLAIVADARLGGRADQSAIAERLLSISGEDGITIDRKYAAHWTGQLTSRP